MRWGVAASGGILVLALAGGAGIPGGELAGADSSGMHWLDRRAHAIMGFAP